MTVDAIALKALHERRLEGDMEPPVKVDRLVARMMLRASRQMAASDLREQYHRTRSDLHLSHAGALIVFGRPFETVRAMDNPLSGQWRVLDPDDTIVCVGDVGFVPSRTEVLTDRQRAILHMWVTEAECHELVAAWTEHAYTFRNLATAPHRAVCHDAGRPAP